MTTTQTTTPETRRSVIVAQAPGKWWFLGGLKSGRWVAVAHQPDGQWRVEASYPTMEGMDDDPGSQTCTCPFEGHQHQHLQHHVASGDAAVALAERAWQAMGVEWGFAR